MLTSFSLICKYKSTFSTSCLSLIHNKTSWKQKGNFSYLRQSYHAGRVALGRCCVESFLPVNFYNKIKTLIPNIAQLNVNVLINELMNSSNYFINIQFIKYISACFDVRDKLLLK